MITALKWDNLIYTNLKTRLRGVCENITRYPNDAPAEFPALTVTLLDAPGMKTDLERNDAGSVLTYELQAFSVAESKSAEAKQIVSKAVECFMDMGFTLSYIGQVDTTIKYVAKAGAKSRNVYRVVARVKRETGSGDVLPKF